MESNLTSNFIESLKRQLPEYLTLADKNKILEELKRFPDSFNPYTYLISKDVEQGDAFAEVPVYFYANGEKKQVAAMVLSNSCDISPQNKRPIPANVIVATMFSLAKYENRLTASNLSPKAISDIIQAIKAQKVTNLFYLPKHPNCKLSEDYVVRLDSLTSIPLNTFLSSKGTQLFRLGSLGFYIFLFKLSVHFCRFPADR